MKYRRTRYALLFICLPLALSVSIKLGLNMNSSLAVNASEIIIASNTTSNETSTINLLNTEHSNVEIKSKNQFLPITSLPNVINSQVDNRSNLSSEILIPTAQLQERSFSKQLLAKTNTLKNKNVIKNKRTTVAKRELSQPINQTAPGITTGIPKGFDDLLEPQTTLVDIYYNGQPLNSVMATYTQDWLEFEQPKDIISLIGSLIEPNRVLDKLKKKLPTNTSSICYYKAQRDCGHLTPDIADIIFDEGKFKIDLFINPRFISVTRLKMEQYLPPSTSQLSVINSISLAASGGEDVEDIHAVQLTSILGYKNYRLQMNIDHDSENQTRLDQLSLIYDYRDIAYEIGSFKSFAQSNGFYTQRDFLGARVQTSLSSRTDLEQLSGSSIFIFLSERSKVDIFKDGQLIDSRNYNAGNIEIDTRDFPQGAYDIVLKITGDSGRETTETHFYSKSLRLPPVGETLYFAEVGVPESINNASTIVGTIIGSNAEQHRHPHGKSHSVLRGGVISRLSESLGVNASFVGNSDDFSGEFGSFILADGMSFQNNYALSQRDGLGRFYQLDFNKEPFIFTASYRKTERQDIVNYDLEYELLQNDSRQILFNMAIPLESSTVNVFARESQRFGQPKTQVYGANWRKNVYRGSGSLVDFSVDATRSDVETRVLFGFNLRFFSNRVDVGLSARQNHSRLHKTAISDDSTNNYVDRRLRVALKNQFEKLGALSNVFEVNQEQDRKATSLKSELNNEHGFSRVELSQIDQTDNKRLAYSMTSRFNIVASKGKVAIGGNRRNSAGVMINLESIIAPSLSFSVIINDVERAKIDAGKSRFIALQPYETYNILLSPRGDTLVNYDNKPKEVTLYPGNIENLSWDIKQVKVLIMQVVNESGQSVANAKLEDFKGYARTDDLGWIQVRLENSGELKFVNLDGQACIVHISPEELFETVNYLAEKTCH